MNYHLAFFTRFTDALAQDIQSLYENIVSNKSPNWKTSPRFQQFCDVVLKNYPFIEKCSTMELLDSSPWAEEVVYNKEGGYFIVALKNNENINKVFSHLINLANGFGVICYDPQRESLIGEYAITEDDFFTKLSLALKNSSFDDIEGLRDYVNSKYSNKLYDLYLQSDNWNTKDALIHLVQDDISENFSLILHDSINSPSPYSKMIGICYREKDKSIMDKFIVNHEVNEKLIFKEAKKYTKKWWEIWK